MCRRASAACEQAVMMSAPKRCAGSVPRLPFDKLTMRTLLLFITSAILSVEEFWQRIDRMNGLARNAPILFWIGAIASLRNRAS